MALKNFILCELRRVACSLFISHFLKSTQTSATQFIVDVRCSNRSEGLEKDRANGNIVGFLSLMNENTIPKRPLGKRTPSQIRFSHADKRRKLRICVGQGNHQAQDFTRRYSLRNSLSPIKALSG